MTILVTAFDPFGGAETNSSLEVLEALPERIGSAKLEKRVLPTVFDLSAEAAETAAEQLRPGLPCGFVHVPGPEDGLSREELTRGVAAALAAVAESIGG